MLDSKFCALGLLILLPLLLKSNSGCPLCSWRLLPAHHGYQVHLPERSWWSHLPILPPAPLGSLCCTPEHAFSWDFGGAKFYVQNSPGGSLGPGCFLPLTTVVFPPTARFKHPGEVRMRAEWDRWVELWQGCLPCFPVLAQDTIDWVAYI